MNLDIPDLPTDGFMNYKNREVVNAAKRKQLIAKTRQGVKAAGIIAGIVGVLLVVGLIQQNIEAERQSKLHWQRIQYAALVKDCARMPWDQAIVAPKCKPVLAQAAKQRAENERWWKEHVQPQLQPWVVQPQ